MNFATRNNQDQERNRKMDQEKSKGSSKMSDEKLRCFLQFNNTMKETIYSYGKNPDLPLECMDAMVVEMKNLGQQCNLKHDCKVGAIKGRMKILRLIQEIKTLFFSSALPTDKELHNLMHRVSNTYEFLKRTDTTKFLFLSANEAEDDSCNESVRKRLERFYTLAQSDLAKIRVIYGRRRNDITDKDGLDKLAAMLEHENLSIDASTLKDLKDDFQKVLKSDLESGKMIVAEEEEINNSGRFHLLQPQEFVQLFAKWGDIFMIPSLNPTIPPNSEDSFIDFDPNDDDFDFSTPTSQATKKERTSRSIEEYRILYDEVVKIHEDDETKKKTLKELRESSKLLKEKLSLEQFRVSLALYMMYFLLF